MLRAHAAAHECCQVRTPVGFTCDNGTGKFKRRNLEALADLIAGRDDAENEEAMYFPYRSSMYITDFLQDLGTEYQRDGSTRHPPEMFCRLIDQLTSPADQLNEGSNRPRALAQVNEELGREGFEAFYGEDNQCYLRHVGTPTVTILAANPHRRFSEDNVATSTALIATAAGGFSPDLGPVGLVRPRGRHRVRRTLQWRAGCAQFGANAPGPPDSIACTAQPAFALGCRRRRHHAR